MKEKNAKEETLVVHQPTNAKMAMEIVTLMLTALLMLTDLADSAFGSASLVSISSIKRLIMAFNTR